MTCRSCGGSLVEGARFCPHCAEPVRADVPPSDPLRKLLDQALGTHYRVVRELGRGGMGTVYLAHESGLDRDVAIKVLPPDKAQSEQYRERFRREARTAARLSHPNIVPLHAFGEHEGMLYYVMGYVEGESLAERLAREGRIGEPESRRILAAIADALHYAHQRGVLHRDVKPQNILLEQGSGRPMLTDFGISKLTAEGTALTSTGVVVGTPDYMSPEQASGSADLGPRSDLYSLGVVGYAMLSGALPFAGRTPGEVIVKRIASEAPPLPVAGSGVNASVVDAVMKCLAKDPDRRWPDAAAFAQAVVQHDDEDAGPLDGLGVLLTLVGYLALVFFVGWRTAQQPGALLELAGKILPLFVAIGVALLIGNVAHAWWRGLPASSVLLQAFGEPHSWHTWYPRRLRRRANVWDRLPADVRRVRLLGGFACYALMVLVSIVLALHEQIGLLPRPWGRWFAVTIFIFLVPLALFLFQSWRVPERLKRRGLEESEAHRVALWAPLSQASFWSRPAVAALLAEDPRRTVGGPRRDASTHVETRTMAGSSDERHQGG